MSANRLRREFLQGGLAAASAFALPGSKAWAAAPARWAVLAPGFLVLIVRTIIDNKLAEKHGVTLSAPIEYSSVSTYYNDFVAGNLDICMGSWDVFAARYEAGVPIKLLCTITSADMIYILTGQDGVKSFEDMRGKTLAAAQSTGTYRLVSALVKERYKMEIGTDIAVQGVDNPAAAMTLVMANRSDAGLSWEPNISAALKRDPGLRPIFNAGQAYREMEGLELPYFGMAVRTEWAEQNPAALRGLRQTVADCIALINADPQKAVEAVGDASGFPVATMTEALKSKRLGLRFGDLSEASEQGAILKAGMFMMRNGLLPRPIDQGFFVAA